MHLVTFHHWYYVQWCCCCCWWVLKGWRGLWLHPPQRPLPPSRELPLSLWLSPVGGQEPKMPSPSSGKMTNTDIEDYPIWHRADSKDVLFSCGQLLAEHPCATSKRGEQSGDWEKGEVVKERQLDDGEVWVSKVTSQKEKKAAGPFHLLIKYNRLWLQSVSKGWTSIM